VEIARLLNTAGFLDWGFGGNAQQVALEAIWKAGAFKMCAQGRCLQKSTSGRLLAGSFIGCQTVMIKWKAVYISEKAFR